MNTAMAKNVYTGGSNDECYTPAYGVEPILKFIPDGSVVWCPFDQEHSHFVQMIRAKGFEVIHSHIEDGQDFYEYEPEHYDVVISNPPFTGKRFVFERLVKLGKPFAMLMTLSWLNDKAPKIIFKDVDLELLMFDKRIEYENTAGKGRVPFSSAYFCNGLLPRAIVIEEL